MIWEITFLLASLSALIIAPRTFPEESSSSNEIPREYLEDLHELPVVQLITLMPTLDMTELRFDKSDMKLLTTECDVDKDCLNKKKASVNKFRQKMQAIQCVNGLYVLKVFDKLESIMADIRNNSTPIASLQETVKEYHFYLSSMLTLLNQAQWDAYAWQIEIFAFLSGLSAPDVDVETFLGHYKRHIVSWREKVSEFVDRCLQYVYLLDKIGAATTVFHFVESMYKSNDDVTNDLITQPRQSYSVSYLTLQHFHSSDYFIFDDWSKFRIDLNISSNFDRHHFIRDWTLDPIGGNKYNALIAKHIHLWAEFIAWLHLRNYQTIYDQLCDVTEQNGDRKRRMIADWQIFTPSLKRVLRIVGLKENIYWSALNFMLFDFTKINKEELAAREEFTRNYFCQSVENLGLGSASDMNRQLQQFRITKNIYFMRQDMLGTVRFLTHFCDIIEYATRPFKHGFIRVLVAAEGNETFIAR